MLKSPDEIAQTGKDTIDALAKSGAAFADGCHELGQHLVALTHKSVTVHITNGREILDVRTPSDWVNLQSKWAGDWLNAAVSHMTQLSKLSTQVIHQTCEPLKSHFDAAFSKSDGSR